MSTKHTNNLILAGPDYASSNGPHQWTTGPAVQLADIPPLQAATLGIQPPVITN